LGPRIVTGLLFGAHGTQKLLGFPANPMMAGGGGGGPSDGGGMMGTIMLVAGILETFGGLAIVLGFSPGRLPSSCAACRR
jgi:putative oxidoreductase